MKTNNAIEVYYFKPSHDPESPHDSLVHSAGSISGFGSPARFIHALTLPEKMTPGDEFVSNAAPLLRVQRTVAALTEFFSRPLFHVTKKIRVQFHWDSIEVVGSYMEAPNRFLIPIPRRKGSYSWYLKVLCKPTAKPGMKPIYVSIDTVHENLLLKGLLLGTKYFSFLYLLSVLVIGLFFSRTEISNLLLFKDLFGDSKTSLAGDASTPLFLLILFVAFWKQISETLKTLYERHDAHLPENLSYQGIKGFSSHYGITVVQRRTNTHLL